MKFSEVIGQEQVKQRLMQMVHDDRVPHAMAVERKRWRSPLPHICSVNGKTTASLQHRLSAMPKPCCTSGNTPTFISAILSFARRGLLLPIRWRVPTLPPIGITC